MANIDNLKFWMGGDSEVAAIVITNKETTIPAAHWEEFIDWWQINNAEEAMDLIATLNSRYLEFVADTEWDEMDEDEAERSEIESEMA